MNIASKKMVKIHYTLKDSNGEIIDSSVEGEPLEYMHGTGTLIPGLERQIEGITAGEKRHVVVEAAEGYGEYDESLVQRVPRDRFDATMPIEVGQQFQAETATGPFLVRVTAVDDNEITIDGNHELAGKQLHFDIDVVDVREPTELELSPFEDEGCGGGCSSCGGGCSGCSGSCSTCGEDDL